MPQAIFYAEPARQRIMRGIDRLADTVAITLGPRGRNVVLEHRTSGLPPVVTRDGATVARGLTFSDRVENVGVTLVQQMLSAVTKEAGDGTSTCVLLTRSIAAEATRSMSMGFDARDIRRGLKLALEAVLADLENRVRRADDPRIFAAIAAMAAHGEEDIGELIEQLKEFLGSSGNILVELGNGLSDEIEIVDGTGWEKGYLSPYFVTDKDRHVAELKDPLVLLYDRPVEEFSELVEVLQLARAQGRPLLIVAQSVAEKALPGLLLNHIRRTLEVVAICSPGHGDSSLAHLEDLAAITGGKCVLEASGDSLDCVTLAHLGQARKVIVSEDTTLLVGGGGNPARLQERLASLKHKHAAISADTSLGSPIGRSKDLDELEERMRALSGRFAVIKVGGISEAAMKERMQRIVNAKNSATAALAEGVIPGGGTALLRSAASLADLHDETPGVMYGIGIVRRALEAPIRQIAVNSGHHPAQVVRKVLDNPDDQFGLDARTGEFGNLVDLGIVDSLKVIRMSLQSAVSTAGILMTTECVVSDIPPVDPHFGYTAEWRDATREDPRL
jgi:chaperonin GroEL